MNCPNCSLEMTAMTLDGHQGRPVAIDLCTGCQALWFDKYESLQLAPGSTLRLMKLIGESASRVPTQFSVSMRCPRCVQSLRQTQDMQRNTRFTYFRCLGGHGRFIRFFEFLREKNFISPLSQQQIDELRLHIQIVNCSSCGGPIDLAAGSLCPHCKSPVSVLDMKQPQELLTSANAILGQGQLSLAKYLWIVAGEDCPNLDVRNPIEFFRHVLERVDWRRDLHFQTCTNIDTLDYSGESLNEGSKLVIAAAGPAIRKLPTSIDGNIRLPSELGIKKPRVFMPGVLVVEGEKWIVGSGQWAVSHSCPLPTPRDLLAERFAAYYTIEDSINAFPWIVLADSSEFAARSPENFLWTVFTKSNPATDVFGIEPFTVDKHWGCRGSLVIDARSKPHHAPPLVEDPEVSARVDALAVRGGPLHGII
jgi:hypothetical protein